MTEENAVSGSSILDILKYGDHRLNIIAEEVTDFGEGVKTLIACLFDTMYKNGGCGLAATQCNVHKKVIVIDTKRASPDGVWQFVRAMVNPRIVEVSDEKELGVEGCLSLPGIREGIYRCSKIVVYYQNEDGEPQEIEASGFLARVIQHEVDHLNGLTMIDHVTPQRKKKFDKQWSRR